MIEKDIFLKLMKKIEDARIREDKIQEHINCIFDSSFAIMENPVWEPLDELFGILTGTDRDFLAWWLWEGKKGYEIYVDDKVYVVDTPEKLYDYLCVINTKDETEEDKK